MLFYLYDIICIYGISTKIVCAGNLLWVLIHWKSNMRNLEFSAILQFAMRFFSH